MFFENTIIGQNACLTCHNSPSILACLPSCVLAIGTTFVLLMYIKHSTIAKRINSFTLNNNNDGFQPLFKFCR